MTRKCPSAMLVLGRPLVIPKMFYVIYILHVVLRAGFLSYFSYLSMYGCEIIVFNKFMKQYLTTYKFLKSEYEFLD